MTQRQQHQQEQAEAALLFLLGHEMGHGLARHTVSRQIGLECQQLRKCGVRLMPGLSIRMSLDT